ncbi:MAG: patatin-like phospholipase family protein [Paludibacteraceae bacterium]|nr:patatin-like phospholipase family protein [Paludibacteraceae bacterium]
MIELINKYKIGVALSGGGAKGISHLGALKAIEDLGLKIDLISGVSAGAIIGALYADGNTPEEICEHLSKGSLFQMVSLTKPKNGGLAQMSQYRKFIAQQLKAKHFEDLKRPLIINATELNSGKNVYFEHGPLIDCIVASASVPIFFAPTPINGKLYVDGGIFCNMPASILRKKGCDFVIGVHVNPITPIENAKGIVELSERIFHLAVNGNTIEQKKECNIVIEMKKTQAFGMFDANKAKEIYQIGYDTAMETFNNCDWEEILTQIRIDRAYRE